MSEVRNKAVPFFALYQRAEISADAIDDFIEAWHDAGDEEDRPLTEYLGMTEDEYALWVMDPRTLPLVRAVRAAGGSLLTATARYVDDLRAAADPRSQTAILSLSSWLTRRRAS